MPCLELMDEIQDENWHETSNPFHGCIVRTKGITNEKVSERYLKSGKNNHNVYEKKA